MEKQVLEIKVPKDSEETPEAAAALFASPSNLKSSFWERFTGRENRSNLKKKKIEAGRARICEQD